MEKTYINLDVIVIEVTRKCNLNCAHCLRGKAEDMIFDTAMLPNLFENVEHISSITFDGGEPSLYPDVIRQTLEYIQLKNISLDSFFITTNATFYSQDFIFVLLDLYEYCNKKKHCKLHVSIDQYHTSLNKKAYNMYTAFKFYSDGKEYENDIETKQIINRGNAFYNGLRGAINISDKKSFEIYNYLKYDNNIDIDVCVYVSSNGIITLDCNLSYEMIDDPEYHIGNIHEENLQSILLREIESTEIKNKFAFK